MKSSSVTFKSSYLQLERDGTHTEFPSAERSPKESWESFGTAIEARSSIQVVEPAAVTGEEELSYTQTELPCAERSPQRSLESFSTPATSSSQLVEPAAVTAEEEFSCTKIIKQTLESCPPVSVQNTLPVLPPTIQWQSTGVAASESCMDHPVSIRRYHSLGELTTTHKSVKIIEIRSV